MDFEKDYYLILEVPHDAPEEDIKTAYRRLAKLNHPDLHPGDEHCNEQIKLINEAWEVLGDADQRFVYDTYLASAAAAVDEPVETGNPQPKTKPKHWKTVEERIYITGEIRIKYRGRQDDGLTDDVLKDVYYRIQPLSTEGHIQSNGIYRHTMPDFFRQAYAGAQVILPVPQPVKCTVHHSSGENHYELYLKDLILTEPRISDVTKDDGDSFGTLSATFFAHLIYHRQEETAPPPKSASESTSAGFSGQTGRSEYRETTDFRYKRKEYYAANGDTFWGNWTKETPVSSPVPVPKQPKGCLAGIGQIFVWIIWGIIGLLFLIPLLRLWPVWIVLIFCWLISSSVIRKLFSVVSFLFLIAFIIAIIRTINQPHAKPVPAKTDVPLETEVRRHPQPGPAHDTLITRYRRWQDYEGNPYAGSYTLSALACRNAHLFKQNLAVSTDAEHGYAKMLQALSKKDDKALSGFYHLLDSIGRKNELSQPKFAAMLVSLVQDIPYSLVLPRACDASLYPDLSIQTYLQRPDAHCDPDQRFGINTPVEFLATLKGDCDTRTLLAYTALNHYGYSVAILSSSKYSHSLLGISLPYDGNSYTYNGHRYVLWETTASAPPGILNPEIANLEYWNISINSTP